MKQMPSNSVAVWAADNNNELYDVALFSESLADGCIRSNGHVFHPSVALHTTSASLPEPHLPDACAAIALE